MKTFSFAALTVANGRTIVSELAPTQPIFRNSDLRCELYAKFLQSVFLSFQCTASGGSRATPLLAGPAPLFLPRSTVRRLSIIGARLSIQHLDQCVESGRSSDLQGRRGRVLVGRAVGLLLGHMELGASLRPRPSRGGGCRKGRSRVRLRLDSLHAVSQRRPQRRVPSCDCWANWAGS